MFFFLFFFNFIFIELVWKPSGVYAKPGLLLCFDALQQKLYPKGNLKP